MKVEKMELEKTELDPRSIKNLSGRKQHTILFLQYLHA